MLVSESRRRPGAARPSPLFPHEAQQLLADGSLQQAMEVCRQGLVYFPDQVAGYMILSQIFLAMGKRDRAANVLRDGFRRTGASQLERLHQQLLLQSQIFPQQEGSATKRVASPFTRVADSPGDTAHAQALVSVPLLVSQPVLVPQHADEFIAVLKADTVYQNVQLPEPVTDPVPSTREQMPAVPVMNETAVHKEIHGDLSAAQAAPVETLADIEIILVSAELPAEEKSSVEDGEIIVAESGNVVDAEVVTQDNLLIPAAIPVLPNLDDLEIPAGSLLIETATVKFPQPQFEVEAEAETETDAPLTWSSSADSLSDSLIDVSVQDTSAPVVDSPVDAPVLTLVPPPLPDFSNPAGSITIVEKGAYDLPFSASTVDSKPLAPAISTERIVVPQKGRGGSQSDERTLRLLTVVDGEEAEATPNPVRPISVLAIHKGSHVSRLRSANLRLIPGLEFAPLRHEESVRKQALAPLINQPMPGPELPGRATITTPTVVAAPITILTPSQTGTAFTLPTSSMPPLPPLQSSAAVSQATAPAPSELQPTTQQSRGEEKKRGGERGGHVAATLGKNTTQLSDSSTVGMGEMTPLEELAKRLENARIPVVEDEEHHRPVPFEPSIVSDTLANILVAQGAYAEALKAFQTLARIKPERLDYYEVRIAEMKRQLSEQPPL